MPKKKQTETQAEQSERFRRAVQELVDAGELNPTEAEERFEQMLGKIASTSLPPRSPNEDPPPDT